MYERKAKRYVREKDFSEQANEEMRLYNATMRINRLEMLKANIGLEMIAGHDELEKFMSGILRGRTEAELERQAGILGKTIRTNAQKANAIVNASFHNATFSNRIWQYADDAEYEAWLDYLDKGGTTADWNAFAKAEWEKVNAKNHKRAGMAALIGGNGIPMHEEPILLKEIDPTDTKAVIEQLQSFEKSAIMERTETACVVTRDGRVYKCFGVKDRVFPDSDLGKRFVGASVTHNHPISETVFSFSEDDLWTFLDYGISVMRGCDEKYTYQFTRNAEDVDDYEDIDIGSMTIDDFQHLKMIQLARQHGIGYRRWKND